MQFNEQQIEQRQQRLSKVVDEIGKVIVGQRQVIEQLLISMLAGGHCLLEGVPGLAKTLMVSTLSKTLDLDFRRVQFTPDLMPSDIVGTEILEQDQTSGKRFFKFQQGPVFSNILLADEINRTPPKTQAALLEAMQEKRVSYGGTTYDLPKPFFVLATQNPVEQAGTYSLPEAQLDRFLMFVKVAYPNRDQEMEVLSRTTGSTDQQLNTILTADDIIALQQLVRMVEISPIWLAYVTDLVRATRPDATDDDKIVDDKVVDDKVVDDKVKRYVRWGAGPRAGQSLVLCAKAHAILKGRYVVTFDDIFACVKAVLRHRILLSFSAEADGITTDDVISSLIKSVPKPKSPL